MLMELTGNNDFQFSRENVYYYLVYNQAKYSRVQQSVSRDANFKYVLERAKQERTLFGVDKLEQILFKEVHTYSKEMFEEKFVKPIEQYEQIVIGDNAFE